MPIERGNLVPNCRSYRRPRQRAAHKQVATTLRRYETRRVPVRLRLRIDRAMRDVFRNPDNRYPRIVRTRQSERDAPPDRILSGEDRARHRLVDDGHVGGTGNVGAVDAPAVEHLQKPEAMTGEQKGIFERAEKIATDNLRRLTTLEVSPPDARPRSDFAGTACEPGEACTAIYRPASRPLLAPVSGHLRCSAEDELEYDEYATGLLPAGPMHLETEDFTLHIRWLHGSAASAGGTRFACTEGYVTQGVVISAHNHFRISASSPDGTELSVIVARDGTLYVGHVEVELGCTCELYRR